MLFVVDWFEVIEPSQGELSSPCTTVCSFREGKISCWVFEPRFLQTDLRAERESRYTSDLILMAAFYVNRNLLFVNLIIYKKHNHY